MSAPVPEIISTGEARRIASFYSDPRTPEGCTFQALSQGRRVPPRIAAAAVEYELMQSPGVQELEDLQEWIWS